MLPIALLLNEHGIIKLMIDSAVEKMKTTSKSSRRRTAPEFTDIFVDFFRTYAQRCHEGKEETILFRELTKKQISSEHKRTMDELITEHIYARETVNALEVAQKKYAQGQTDALADIETIIQQLVEFYTKHIEKENTRFYYPVMKYFDGQELDNMVEEFLRFDANVLHIRYIETVENLMRH